MNQQDGPSFQHQKPYLCPDSGTSNDVTFPMTSASKVEKPKNNLNALMHPTYDSFLPTIASFHLCRPDNLFPSRGFVVFISLNTFFLFFLYLLFRFSVFIQICHSAFYSRSYPQYFFSALLLTTYFFCFICLPLCSSHFNCSVSTHKLSLFILDV